MAGNANFCTWNSLHGIKDDGDFGITYSEGNTKATQTHNGISTTGTMAVKSGKWYWEIRYAASSDFSDGHLLAGWQSLANGVNYAYTVQQPGAGAGAPDRNVWGSHLMNYMGGGTAAYGGGYLSAGNDVNNDTYSGAFNLGLRVSEASTLQFAGDFDNNDLYFGVNNTWYDLAAGTNSTSNTDITQVTGWPIEAAWRGNFWTPACWFSGAASGTVSVINCGQDSTFAGLLTATSNADANGFGEFVYSPPSGYLALCSANLPISADIDPAQTDDDIVTKQFGVVTYTGNGGAQSVTGMGFKPDLVWVKRRNAIQSNRLADSTRGAKTLYTDDVIDEDDMAISYTSDGFDWGTGTGAANNSNASGGTYVAWGWRANGGTETASISESGNNPAASVQANPKGGLSIITYTGTGGAGTIAHGLDVAPEFMIIKNRGVADPWAVYHAGVASDPATDYLVLNTNAAVADDSTYWNDTAPTSSVLTVGTNHSVNADGENYVAYVWAPVEGFSRFGIYEGNVDDNGPFVYTGFRPKIIFIKEIDNNDDWVVYDTARSTFNPAEKVVRWEEAAAEFDDATRAIDILANGFKIRTSNNTINQASTFVYGAWGDVPFKYNNTF
jgi:hypothetical protein